jgi:hypothetical protein
MQLNSSLAARFAAPYLTNERSHHMLQLLSAKDKIEKALDEFLKHFR